jgi:cold shock CspA family protein
VERGTVAFWHNEEGWGGIEVPGRSGVGFAHFSNIAGLGYRYLVAGEPVEVEFEDDFGQDGCQWRAASVNPLNPHQDH